MINEIIWSLPGTSLICGEAYGIEAVIKRSQLVVNYNLNFGLKNILFGQHSFALSLNNTARRGDLVLDEHLATVFSLSDGKISRIDTYLSDVDMGNAFFIELNWRVPADRTTDVRLTRNRTAVLAYCA